jgi:N-acetylglucosaminyldiphosphoundecaprenol N-acetyl-beta-D-mannosaminyltransferase
VSFRVTPLESAINALCDTAMSDSEGVSVHFANAYSVAIADGDDDYARVFADDHAITFSDGVPVTWIGRRAFPELEQQWQRVYGPDVMAGVLDRCHRDGLPISHYLVGGSPETLARLQIEIAERWPGVTIAGAESPPFRPLTAAEVTAQRNRITTSSAQMVWVGLGTPKQDFAARELANDTQMVVLAVGAAFDFLAGTKSQAPRWMQRNGLEWIYRLATEPRRLFRRYFWGNPRFLVAAARQPGLGRGRD